eukprot:6482163-Amphidinium_carterae.1
MEASHAIKDRILLAVAAKDRIIERQVPSTHCTSHPSKRAVALLHFGFVFGTQKRCTTLGTESGAEERAEARWGGNKCATTESWVARVPALLEKMDVRDRG